MTVPPQVTCTCQLPKCTVLLSVSTLHVLTCGGKYVTVISNNNNNLSHNSIHNIYSVACIRKSVRHPIHSILGPTGVMTWETASAHRRNTLLTGTVATKMCESGSCQATDLYKGVHDSHI